MMVLTKSEIVKLLNIKGENLSTLINTLEQLSKDEGISRVAFVDDIVSGRIDAQVLEVINVEGKSIAILDYFGDKTTIDEVIEGLECEDPLLYRYILPLPCDKSQGAFQVINYDIESETVELEQLVVSDDEPYSFWAHVKDLRVI